MKAHIRSHNLWLTTGGSQGRRFAAHNHNLRGADLRFADLSHADLSHADLSGADLTGAVMRHADLTRADLSGAILTGATLQYSLLQRAYMKQAKLNNADLHKANLDRAFLLDADLSRANLNQNSLDQTTGDGRYIKNVPDTLRYPVAYTATHIQIGCKNYLIEDWRTFSNKQIHSLDGDQAVDFWNQQRDRIFKQIDEDPALPTGWSE